MQSGTLPAQANAQSTTLANEIWWSYKSCSQWFDRSMAWITGWLTSWWPLIAGTMWTQMGTSCWYQWY